MKFCGMVINILIMLMCHEHTMPSLTCDKESDIFQNSKENVVAEEYKTIADLHYIERDALEVIPIEVKNILGIEVEQGEMLRCVRGHNIGYQHIPQKEAAYPYKGTWDGTENYIFTKVYFSSNHFQANAETPFDAAFYSLDGTYVGSVLATEMDSIYSISTKLGENKNYYVGLYNSGAEKMVGSNINVNHI